MKKIVQLAILAGVVTLVACKDDEEKIDPIVGKWELDLVTYSSAPSGYVWLRYSTNNTSLFGEVFHEMEFKSDNTYEREMRFSDGSRIREKGVWEKSGDDLDLDVDESMDEDAFLTDQFTISEEITDELTLVARLDNWPSLTVEFVEAFNETIDTITSSQSYNDILFSNAVPQSVEITLEFSKD